jgi:Secretion system C-terminal sorting domain/PA domain
MRKKLLSLWALAALTFGFGFAAQAQYSLFVSAPTSVRGTVSATADPSATGWGFGDPQTITPPVCGVAQYASPDTVVSQTPPAVGSLTGKIAVVYRGGGIEFGVKALACQLAGAVGVIIINKTNGAMGGMAAGSVGDQVTIPVILVPLPWEATVRSFIASGQLTACIGNPLGAYSLNLSLLPSLLVFPSPLHMPSHMVKRPGDFSFRYGARILNSGTQAQQNVKLITEIERILPTRTLLEKDSTTFANIAGTGAPGDTTPATQASFPKFDLVSSLPGLTDYTGQYRITYRIVTANADSVPDDNIRVYDFYVGQDAPTGRFPYSRTRLNLTDGKFTPITTTSTTRAAGTGGDQTIKWGQYIRTGSTGGRIDSLTYGSSTINANLTGADVSIEVQEWDDLNGNFGITDDELTLKGTNSRTYTSEAERGVFYTDPVVDALTGEPGVELAPFKRYLVLWSYAGSTTITVNADEYENFLQYATVDTIGDFAGVLNVAPNWVYGFTGLDVTPAFRINLAPPTAIKPGKNALLQLKVYPNPATDKIQISLGDVAAAGQATIQIRDMAGRVVAQEVQPITGSANYYKMSVAGLEGGVYNVVVTTPRGSKAAKLVITR